MSIQSRNLPRSAPRKSASMPPKQKFTLYFAAVLLIALAIGIANYSVFPEAFWMVTILLVVDVIIAGLFTWYGPDATPKVQRYCAWAHLAICIVLCVNVSMHLMLAREVSAIHSAVETRHTEEDRTRAWQREASERRLKEMEAQRKLLEAGALKDSSASASTYDPGKLLSGGAGGSEEAAAGDKSYATSRRTVEDIRREWWWPMTLIAIFGTVVSIVGGGWLKHVWEWDRNHNGKNDAEEEEQDADSEFAESSEDSPQEIDWDYPEDDPRSARRRVYAARVVDPDQSLINGRDTSGDPSGKR